MFVPNFKILGTVVPEKSLTKKKKFTHRHTEKAKTIYPLYTSYTGGYNYKLEKDCIKKEPKQGIEGNIELLNYK